MKTGLQLWAGSQQSYQQYVEGTLKARADAGFSATRDFGEDVVNEILSVNNGVACINIAGSLVDGSAGFGVYFGMIGYNDIRNALAAAVSDPEVESILLNISSGGGMVAGCHECAQLIARVNTVKPVITYTGSAMASAALWLGSQAQHMVSAETAIVGSIGILMVHMDRTEQLKQEGIKATIIRAGSEKALANPFEALTDAAKTQLQDQADALYAIFLGQVASARGVTAAKADTKFGQGREFLGKAALDVGLVDAIGTIEDAYAKAISKMPKKKPGVASVKNMMIGATNRASVQAQASTVAVLMADNQTNPPQGTEMTMKKPLTAEQLIAMAAGVTLDAEIAKTPEQLAAEAAAAAAAAGAAEAEAALAAAAAPPAVAATPAVVSEATALLQGMLTAANAELLTARTDLTASNAALVAANAALAPATALASSFVEIARASVRTMGLHFGVTGEAAAAMAPAEVLTEHSRLAGLFQSKFKVGGVAAASLGKPEAVASAPTMTVREQQIAMKLPRAK